MKLQEKTRLKSQEVSYYMNILILIVAIVGGAAGLLSTIYLTFSLPAIIIWKIYRRIHLGIPITK